MVIVKQVRARTAEHCIHSTGEAFNGLTSTDAKSLTSDAFWHHGAQVPASCSVSPKRRRRSNRKKCPEGWPASTCISLAHVDLEQAVVFFRTLLSSPCSCNRRLCWLYYSILSTTYVTGEHCHPICATTDSMDCGANGKIQSHPETRSCHLDSIYR